MRLDVRAGRGMLRPSEFVMGTPLSFADKAAAIVREEQRNLRVSYENNRKIVSYTTI